MKLLQAYRFALDATPGQQRALMSHCGAARKAYNWGLANLAQGLTNWCESRSGKRKGRKVGFPTFKSRRLMVASCRFTTGAIRVEADRRHVTLPRLGTIKTHESTRKLARRIANGTARVLSATVRREAERWFVSFTCEVDRADRSPARPDAVVAVDLGVKHLAVLSTGEQVPNPQHLAVASRRLRRLARAVSRKVGPYDPATKRRRDASKRWIRANRAVGRVHRRVTDLRRDGIHQLTTRLAGQYGTIVVEDLHVAGMLRNRRLAKVISDAGFAEIRRQLDYKTAWCGGRLLVADRWYPSSKTCSGCGAVKAEPALSERTYTCDTCGLVLDRDHNAARNLAALAAKIDVAASGAETVNGRGANRKTPPVGQVAVKRLPGTALADQTGTAAPQGAASNSALTKVH